MLSVRQGEVSEDAKTAVELKRVRRRGRAGEGPAREQGLGIVSLGCRQRSVECQIRIWWLSEVKSQLLGWPGGRRLVGRTGAEMTRDDMKCVDCCRSDSRATISTHWLEGLTEMSGKGIKKVWDVANCQSAVVFTGTGADAKRHTCAHLGMGKEETSQEKYGRDDELAARRAWPFLIRDHPPNRAQGCGDVGRLIDWLTD